MLNSICNIVVRGLVTSVIGIHQKQSVLNRRISWQALQEWGETGRNLSGMDWQAPQSAASLHVPAYAEPLAAAAVVSSTCKQSRTEPEAEAGSLAPSFQTDMLLIEAATAAAAGHSNVLRRSFPLNLCKAGTGLTL